MNRERIIRKVMALLTSPIQERIKEIPEIKNLAKLFKSITKDKDLQESPHTLKDWDQIKKIQFFSELKKQGIIKKHLTIPNMEKVYRTFMKNNKLNLRLES